METEVKVLLPQYYLRYVKIQHETRSDYYLADASTFKLQEMSFTLQLSLGKSEESMQNLTRMMLNKICHLFRIDFISTDGTKSVNWNSESAESLLPTDLNVKNLVQKAAKNWLVHQQEEKFTIWKRLAFHKLMQGCYCNADGIRSEKRVYKPGKLFSPRSTWLHEEAQIQAFENMMICRGKLLNEVDGWDAPVHGNESQMSILAPLFCLTGKANCVGGAFSLTQLESVQWLHAGVASVPLVINASKMVPGASKNLMKQLFGLIKDVLEKSTRVIVLEHKQFSYKAKTFTETFTVNTLNGDVYCPRWVLAPKGLYHRACSENFHPHMSGQAEDAGFMTQACFKQLKTEMYQSQVDACKASLERLETLCPIEACACIRYGEDDLQTQIKFASDALSHAEEVLSQHKDTRLLSVVDQVCDRVQDKKIFGTGPGQRKRKNVQQLKGASKNTPFLKAAR